MRTIILLLLGFTVQAQTHIYKDAQFLVKRLVATSYTPTGKDLTALNTLMVDSKIIHKWYDSVDIIYPVIGTSASSHALEMKTSSGTYNITWFGGVTQTATGVQGNGTTGYGNTAWNPSTAGVRYTANNASFYMYLPAVQTGANNVEFGGTDGSNINQLITSGFGLGQFTRVNQGPLFINSANTSPGGFQSVRFALSLVSQFRNGIQTATDASIVTTGIPNASMYFCAYNNNGTAAFFSTSTWNFACAGAAIYPVFIHADVLKFETTLGRN